MITKNENRDPGIANHLHTSCRIEITVMLVLPAPVGAQTCKYHISTFTAMCNKEYGICGSEYGSEIYIHEKQPERIHVTSLSQYDSIRQ
ncbi:unnamed protein product [Prunus armeniaca]